MPNLSLEEFADKLNKILPIIIKEFSRRQVNELYKGKITLPQFLVLDFLNSNGGLKMKDLAHFMGVTTAAMTGIVDRLVRDRFVLREFDPKDRRIIKIKLTPKGSSLVRKINEQRSQMVIKIFGKISEKDRREYLRILMHIKEILAKEKEG